MSESATGAALAATGTASGGAARPATIDPSATVAGAGGNAAIIAIVAAAGAAVLALIAGRSSEPLLLTLVSALAMLGVFFLFALAAGHVRIGERVDAGALVSAAADQIPDALVLTRRDGGVVYANAAAARLLGADVRADGATLEAILAGLPGASEQAYRLLRAAARGDSASEEIVLPSPAASAGPGRLLRVTSKPFLLPGPERDARRDLERRALWQIADVSAERDRQQRSQEELRARLADYDTSAVGLLTLAGDGTLVDANRRLATLLGFEHAALIDRGMRADALLSADAVQLLWGQARRDGADAAGLDLDVKRADGRIAAVHLVPALRRMPGQADRLVVAVLDRAPAEAAAAAIEPATGDVRFARFFQSAPFGIATVAGDGRIASANAAFARMILDDTSGVGAKATDALARSAGADARAALEAALAEVLSGRVPQGPVEIAVGDKGEYVRRVFLYPLQGSDTAREAAILYAVDATEEKALAARFAQSQKMDAIGKLVGGIAHDFNNMLTAIIGFSDMLLQQHRATDPAHKDLMNIKKSAVRAAEIVAKLLAMSRQRTLQVEPLLLDEVVTDFAPFIKRAIGETIELKVSNGSDLWYVKTDKAELEQAVLLNLAVNARDAMPEGGSLSIRTYNVSERDCQKLAHDGMTVGEYVAIEVSDTGTGMSDEVLHRIFEPYFTTKAVGKGTGLGLASVMGTLKQCGGYIYPESEVGKGTTFRLYLPRYHIEAEEIAAVKAARNKEVSSADLTGSGCVLLVEDEDLVRSFGVRALKSRGYTVLEAADGQQALEVMAKHPGEVDIVVSDVVMPEMDGPTLLKELRKDNPDLKFIFVSGYPNENFKAAVGDNAKFAFLPKPYSLPQLAAKVKEQLAAKG